MSDYTCDWGAARAAAERSPDRHPMTDGGETTPAGIYLVNTTGEMSALATEDGGGDHQLLREVLTGYSDATDADVRAAVEATESDEWSYFGTQPELTEADR